MLISRNLADITTATIDLKVIVTRLMSKGSMTGKEWFNGCALGREVDQGKGSTIIHSFSITYQ